MSNPATIKVGNITYNLSDERLLVLDDNNHQLDFFPLKDLDVRSGLNSINESVYSLELLPKDKESILIKDTDLTKGNLTVFHDILLEKLDSIAKA